LLVCRLFVSSHLLPSPIICLSPCAFSLCPSPPLYFFFFFNDTATPEIYTLSLHDALPICDSPVFSRICSFESPCSIYLNARCGRSEEHTSELQSRFDLVCRLLLEKKKKYTYNPMQAVYTRRYAWQ